MKTRIKLKKERLGDLLNESMRELEAILATGKRPEDVLTVRTIEVIEPPKYTPRNIRSARHDLGLSTALFAGLMGVSKKLVEHWESGRRVPSAMACRLLDAIQHDPSRFVLRTMRKPAA